MSKTENLSLGFEETTENTRTHSDALKNVFSDQLVYHLNENNMSVDRFCTLMGIKKNTYRNWINGVNMPTLSTMEQIARILNCAPKDLVSRKVKPLDPAAEKHRLEWQVIEDVRKLSLDELREIANIIELLKR